MQWFQRHMSGGSSVRRIIYNILDYAAQSDDQINLTKQNRQPRQFLGDCLGAVSIFIILFAGLFFVGVFQ